ncbi:MAG: hypothetical protein KC503_10735 [Myxococcales bacterium]|nr:hypothetical protein [Myxococcales bacterium]
MAAARLSAVALALAALATYRQCDRPARALPYYTARSGRTCDNCHTDPTGWKNPELAYRKCTLSCLACHVNPTGGGLRTVSGRFFGQATLPMMFASHRGYKDASRHLTKYINFESQRKNRLFEAHFWGPAGGSAMMSWDQGRYAGLNADPLLSIGVDVRMALWANAGRALFFPMQLDTNLALHPLRYVTAYTSAGVLAKSKGFAATFERRTPYMVKDAFLMVHQLPYLLYLRAGRFIPPFGTFLDDHTAPVRREVELDQGIQSSRVLGFEVGFAPNYPYAHLTLFRPNRRDSFTAGEAPFFGVSGWGAMVSAGWRDLGWQLGLSAMSRTRDLADGGETRTLSLQWGFNPWFYSDSLPFTLLGEILIGRRQRQFSGTVTTHLAGFAELDYAPFNGVHLRARWDFADADFELAGDDYHRGTFGGDLVLLPGLTISTYVRVQKSTTNSNALVDGIVMMHAWY